jgi:hypothetical protein
VINYLEMLKAELQEKPLGDELSKLPKAPFDSFGSDWGGHVSQTESRRLEAAERAASIPRGYTRAELEAARLDARRLGYPGRTVH